MIKKKYYVKLKDKSQEQQQSKILFFKENLGFLYKTAKNEFDTLLLIMEHGITYNDIVFSITPFFYDYLDKKTTIGRNNLNTHLTKLAKRNIIKKIAYLTYAYNPYIMYYGDNNSLILMREKYDSMINLCLKNKNKD